MRMVKAGRVLGLAAVAALAMPGASLAAGHGTAQAHAPRAAGQRHVRPGRRVVTSWTNHSLPSGSLNEANEP